VPGKALELCHEKYRVSVLNDMSQPSIASDIDVGGTFVTMSAADDDEA
jgi:hypothetical protein